MMMKASIKAEEVSAFKENGNCLVETFDRVVFIRFSDIETSKALDCVDLSGGNKESIMEKTFRTTLEYDDATVIVNRRTLIEILKMMDSDMVTLRASTDCPLGVEGRSKKGTQTVTAVIAPIIQPAVFL